MFDILKEDIASVRDRDPAVGSVAEVLFLYPGVKAIRAHRRAHKCYEHGFIFLARMISQRAARKTGIEIHPGATIGRRVMIGAGAKVLGPLHIGDNSKIAAGSVVLNDIPANCTAVGTPARVVKLDGVRVEHVQNLDQIHIPDPVAQELERLENEIKELSAKLEAKEKENK